MKQKIENLKTKSQKLKNIEFWKKIKFQKTILEIEENRNMRNKIETKLIINQKKEKSKDLKNKLKYQKSKILQKSENVSNKIENYKTKYIN